MQLTSEWATSASSGVGARRGSGRCRRRGRRSVRGWFLDGRIVAVDTLLGVVGAGKANEADAVAAFACHRLLHQLASRRAELGVRRADIGDALGLGRVQVEW